MILRWDKQRLHVRGFLLLLSFITSKIILLDVIFIRQYFVIMNKKQKSQTKSGLKKEHFEILLENIDDKLKVVSEGYTLLNNKIDNLGNDLHTEIKETRQELIFLIKATVEHAEERLNKRIDGVEKKIEDGDNAVVAQLTKKIEDGDNAVKAELTMKIELAKKVIVENTDQKIEEVKEILRLHSERLDNHEERLSKLNHSN